MTTITRAILSVGLLCTLAANVPARAQTAPDPKNLHWTTWKESPEAVFTGQHWCASDPALVKVDGTYHMFYTAVDPSFEPARTVIAHATSTDGLKWENVKVEGPIEGLALKGVDGSWEEALEGAFIVKTDNEFLLYYSGYPDKGDPARGFPAKLAVATSKDGTQFERHPDNPILPPTPGGYDNDAVYCPTIVKDDDTFYMVYAAHCYSKCDKGQGVRLLGATSKDGITWEKREAPVMDALPDVPWAKDGVAEPSLVKGPDGKFYLFFTGLEGEGRLIGFAVGDAPFGPWTVNPTPIVTPSKKPGTFDEALVLAPDVLIEDGKARLWHLGYRSDGHFAVGYAEAPWPLFTKQDNATQEQEESK